MSLDTEALQKLTAERPEDVQAIAREVTELLGTDQVLTQSLEIMSFTKQLHMVAMNAIKRRLDGAVSDPDIAFRVLKEAHRAFKAQVAGFTIKDLEMAASTVFTDYFDMLAAANMFQIAAPKEAEAAWEQIKKAATEAGMALTPEATKTVNKSGLNRKHRRAKAAEARKPKPAKKSGKK
jgi:hypothetical protein